MKQLLAASVAAAIFSLVSCETHNHYPIEVVEAPKPAPKKTTPKPAPKPKPKPVETAEGFRAVEKPGSYSN